MRRDVHHKIGGLQVGTKIKTKLSFTYKNRCTKYNMWFTSWDENDNEVIIKMKSNIVIIDAHHNIVG